VVKVVLLKQTDWSEFYSLYQEVVERDFCFYPETVRKVFCQAERLRENLGKSKQIWLAKKDNQIAGFLVGIKSKSGISYVNWMGVKEGFRGQGLGAKLIPHWEKWARDQEAHKLRIATSNPNNLPFYQKFGYELEGVRKNDKYGLDFYLLGKQVGTYEIGN